MTSSSHKWQNVFMCFTVQITYRTFFTYFINPACFLHTPWSSHLLLLFWNETLDAHGAQKKKKSPTVCQQKCPRCCELLRKRPCWSKPDSRENCNMIRKAGLHAKHAHVCLAFQVEEQTRLNMQTFVCRQMSRTVSRGRCDTRKLWICFLTLEN